MATTMSATVPTRRPASSTGPTRQQSTHRAPIGDPADASAGASDHTVAVGIALHSFTEPLRGGLRTSPAELHRWTTVLTKQIGLALETTDRFRIIRRLVTDPRRVAAPDGRTAEEICRSAWTMVQSVADQRALGAIEGALAFGETAILRLAATRVTPGPMVWWGTPEWPDFVEEWVAGARDHRRHRDQLLRSPETVSDALLTTVLDR